MKNNGHSGFTLVQLSVMLMVASLVMVTILPSSQATLDNNRVTSERMNALYKYFRAYMVANGGVLPCPADATLAQDASNYGVAAANSGSVTDCSGGTPAANYVDASHNVAIGMVPVKTLGLSNDYAYDAWGRAITYAVDTAVTGSCWASPATGAITVTDNGTANTTVMALISHGADGHGAFIPLAGASGTAVRLNNNSSDTNELLNAHVDSSFAPTSTLTNFVLTLPTSTFDDIIVYKSPFWNMGTMPTSATASGATITSVTAPASGVYYPTNAVEGTYQGNTISFTVTFSSPVTVSGTPRIAVTATAVGGAAVSLSGAATGYATWVSGTNPSTTHTFTYTLASADMAPNGISIASPIDLNGGSISPMCGASPTFTPVTLSGVIIPKLQVILASSFWTVPADWNNSFNFIDAVGSGGRGAQGGAPAGGGGGGGGGYAYVSNLSLTPGNTINVTVGTNGAAIPTQFRDSSTLVADYGRNGSVPSGGAGGKAALSVGTSPANGGTGGAGGASGGGGGGGGGGAAGAGTTGRTGGVGAINNGGGGGGGGANGGGDTAGVAGNTTAGTGGNGGKGNAGNTVTNKGAAGGGAGGAGTTDYGTGGGGGGGSSVAGTPGGAGGNGSASLKNSPTFYIGWTTNIAPIGNYSVGGGGGGSGGNNAAGSTSGNGGTSAGYGAGGGGSGSATGMIGNYGAGTDGLVVITWR